MRDAIRREKKGRGDVGERKQKIEDHEIVAVVAMKGPCTVTGEEDDDRMTETKSTVLSKDGKWKQIGF
ncbi:hypothetical protein EYF80_048226 [Liparis tanakae]|uniref:Uncharacterized protein n=1 Tax=Liparis tanakae TaxID=230148 RepID=A0A4Z2FKS4_9TELE|nr:hypothetical protein EYF80_048226 [Liparis tanakae]